LKIKKKQAKARAIFRANYLQKFGLNKDRDFSILDSIIKSKTATYLSITVSIAKQREKTDIVKSGATMEDISKLTTETMGMLSDEYKNILLVYFGNIENLVTFVTMKYAEIQMYVIEINKQKLSQIKGFQL
jgi:hypothetical protein